MLNVCFWGNNHFQIIEIPKPEFKVQRSVHHQIIWAIIIIWKILKLNLFNVTTPF